MKNVQIALLLWLVSFFSFTYSKHTPSDYIKEFNDSAIKLTLEKTTYSLIYFYSDSCKYCQLFNPVFENLCTLYNEDSEATGFQILKTNARVNKKLSKLFGIRHYPTLKLLHYPSKEILEYEGKRDLHSLIDYIGSKTTLTPNYENFKSEVKNIENPKELLENSKDKLVIFIMSHLIDWQDYHYPSHYIQRISNTYEDIDFYVYHGDDLNHAELLPQFGVSNFPSLVYIRNGEFKSFNTEPPAYQTNDKFNGDKIIKFIESIDSDGSLWRSIEAVSVAPVIGTEQFEDDEDSEEDIEHIEL
ncbi:ERP44 [Candida margitis]|uniref:ERP44 n=1 Tax=Candida margitis TaxID=1775924 RepID=UPI002227CFA8|nr:ERP44 [Candida margitis]KAI5970542.1 ERP44 [Candida margitis]